MPDCILTTIEATVISKTKEALLKHSEITGLSIGEIIDRITLDFSIDDPVLAASTLCEEFLIMAANQTQEQVRETVKKIIAYLTIPIIMSGTDEEDFFNDISDDVHHEIDSLMEHLRAQ